MNEKDYRYKRQRTRRVQISRSISEVDVDVASMSMSLGKIMVMKRRKAATIISSPSSNVFEARYYKARGGSTPVSAGAQVISVYRTGTATTSFSLRSRVTENVIKTTEVQ